MGINASKSVVVLFVPLVALAGQALAQEEVLQAEEDLSEEISWGFLSGVAAAALGCCVCSAAAMACAAHLFNRQLTESLGDEDPASWGLVPLSEGDPAKRVEELHGKAVQICVSLHKEVMCALLAQPCAGVASGLAAGALAGGNVPGIVQGLALLGVLHAARQDAYFMRHLEGNDKSMLTLGMEHLRKVPTFPFWLSKLEVADMFTDGVALAKIVWLHRSNPFFRARALAAWESTALAPVVETVGLPGLMVGALIVGTSAQIISVSLQYESGTAADLAGLGATADLLKEAWIDSEDVYMSQNSATFGKHASRAFMENGLQLFLQGSAVMAVGEGLASQPALAASMSLSCVMGLKKAKELVGASSKISALFLVLLLLWAIARPFLAERCESRVYGLTTGCVEMPAALLPEQ